MDSIQPQNHGLNLTITSPFFEINGKIIAVDILGNYLFFTVTDNWNTLITENWEVSLVTSNVNYRQCSLNKICGWKGDLMFTPICVNLIEVNNLREIWT